MMITIKRKNFFSDDAGNLNDVTNRAKRTTDKSVSYYSENIDDHCCLEIYFLPKRLDG